MVLASASLVQTQSQSDTETPEVYVLSNGKPEGVNIEIALGGTRSFTAANGYMFKVGTREPFPLKSPPSAVRWSVAANATPGVYTLTGVIPAKTMTRDVWVYDPRRTPLIGRWHEAAQAGAVTLTLPTNRQISLPPDISPRGTASVDSSGRLILKGIWLGRPSYIRAPAGASAVNACGHVFVH